MEIDPGVPAAKAGRGHPFRLREFVHGSKVVEDLRDPSLGERRLRKERGGEARVPAGELRVRVVLPGQGWRGRLGEQAARRPPSPSGFEGLRRGDVVAVPASAFDADAPPLYSVERYGVRAAEAVESGELGSRRPD